MRPGAHIAFWPAYVGTLRSAPFTFHAHGSTASAWIVPVAAQGWTVHSRRLAWHRRIGQAVFVLIPPCAGGVALGPLPGLDDLISAIRRIGRGSSGAGPVAAEPT